MFSSGKSSVCLSEILDRVTESEILSFYLGITEVPCIIKSPLREDHRPSFGLYSSDGKKISYKDLATQDSGGLFDLLSKMWGTTFIDTITRVYNDIPKMTTKGSIREYKPCTTISTASYNKNINLECKVREWKKHDIDYWNSYGISLKWLKYAEVYPISHKIIVNNLHRYTFGADKYAYAYVEHKEGKVTLKIYQPYNKKGWKWSTNIDRSVWSLWTKIPKTGDNLIISSSLKDCLNIWANTGIPAICMQGEGYLPKPHVMEELKKRFKNIIVFYDNDYTNPDNPGRIDSTKLSKEYNLKRVEIPAKYEAKDPSDCYHKYGKEKYLEIINEILKDVLWKSGK